MVINVSFRNGGITRFTMNPAEQHDGNSCGTVEHVEITDNGLIWRPMMIRATDGERKLPTLAWDIKSVSETPPAVCCTLGTTTTTTTKFYEMDFAGEFVLVPANELAEAVEVNIDGSIAYTRNDHGVLASAANDGEVDDQNKAADENSEQRSSSNEASDAEKEWAQDMSATAMMVPPSADPNKAATDAYLRSILDNFDF